MSVVDDLEELLRHAEGAVEHWVTNFEDFLAAHPELTEVTPSAAGGWATAAGVVGALVAIVESRRLPHLDVVQALHDTFEHLRRGRLSRTDALAWVGRLWDLVERIRGTRAQLRGRTNPVAPVVPSPTDILTQELASLRRTVAVLSAWRGAHHAHVHGRLVGAEAQAADAVDAALAAAAEAIREAALVLRQVVTHDLPTLRRRLVTEVGDEAQARARADVRLARALQQEAQAIEADLDRVVRWVAGQVVPALEADLGREAQARQQADTTLRQGLATEAQTREQADTALEAALAPMLAWWMGPGQHTAEKVRRNEDWLDQLARTDVNWAAQLLTGGPFVELTWKLLAPVAGQIPGLIHSLERMAAEVVGVL